MEDKNTQELERILKEEASVPYSIEFEAGGLDSVTIKEIAVDGDYGVAMLQRDAYSNRTGYPHHSQVLVTVHLPTRNIGRNNGWDQLLGDNHYVRDNLTIEDKGDEAHITYKRASGWGTGIGEKCEITAPLHELEYQTKERAHKGTSLLEDYALLDFWP